MDMKFLKNFEKDLNKLDVQIGVGDPPRYWYSVGNYALNRIISGSFYRGIPQGRVTGLVGPSGAGKSFLAANLLASAQREGAFALMIDAENASDETFVKAIGVDTSPSNYRYVGVRTIPQVTKVMSSFIKGYKNEYKDGDPDAPQIIIAIDSLDMLMTDTEEKNWVKGVVKGDQGQRNKQLKQMLRTFVQAIKQSNISIIVTDGVYKNQDLLNGEGLYVAKEAIRFSLSQIIMLTKFKLKDDTKTKVRGIKMKCEGFKTRFTQPFQNVVIEVPYEEGMNPFSGLLSVGLGLKIIQQSGAWYNIAGSDKKWYSKDISEYADEILEKAEAMNSAFLLASGVSDDDLAAPDDDRSSLARRQETADNDKK